jgi:hypothetical protein
MTILAGISRVNAWNATLNMGDGRLEFLSPWRARGA